MLPQNGPSPSFTSHWLAAPVIAATQANGTALHEAAAAGHKDCVVLLLDKGAQIAAMDKVREGRICTQS
jgi:hypothetical protein